MTEHFRASAGTMTAFDDLFIKEWLLEFLHLCRKLSRMCRTHSIVVGGSKNQRLRVVHIRLELVIGRDRREKIPAHLLKPGLSIAQDLQKPSYRNIEQPRG
jgi:hypothetical protein